MDSDPVGTLIAALRDEDRIVGARAAQLLGELAAAEGLEPLIEYVTECRYHCKTTGFAALAAIGDRGACEAIRPLVDAPNVEDDWYWIGCKSVRAAAALALLALGDDSGAEYLTELADADSNIFFAWFTPAILALPDELDATAPLKGRITVDTCCAAGGSKTRQTDPCVVASVTEVLGLLATDAAHVRLRELLGHRSRYVRGQAAVSLSAAEMSDANAEAVGNLLDDDPTDFVRIKAALALSLAGRSHADAIVAAAESAADPFDQAAAVEALGLLGASEHAGVISAQLQHADAYVRRCAIAASDRLATAMIEPLCDDPDALVRLQAAKFMAEGGDA